MTARGVDFLQNWIAANVPATENPNRALVLASQCIIEAAGQGISLEELEKTWSGVEDAIKSAIVQAGKPRMPGD